MENRSDVDSPTLADIIGTRRLSRRRFLGGALALSGASMVPNAGFAGVVTHSIDSSLSFSEVDKNLDVGHRVASGYNVQVLMRWGDALKGGNAAFHPLTLTATQQQQRFGYNNDYVAYLPLPRGSSNSQHGLLCVNHEYCNSELMFTDAPESVSVKRERAYIEMEAQGCSIVEVRKVAGEWRPVSDSTYNRRITATTPMAFSGVASGHDGLKTRYDPKGVRPIGTFANCAGGVTPWGTVLTAEENFDHYFTGEEAPETHISSYKRYDIESRSYYAWHEFDARFDYSQEPNEPNRFGWIVEYDPYDPDMVPIKRTSLGRFKHECATTHVNYDGRVVVYSGDDEAFEYIYRYVSTEVYEQGNDAANANLLDDGVLSVARFYENGTMEWLPLVFGQGKLTPEYGIHSQADIAIYTRKAADLVGATPMDRPEDIEINPCNGALFVSLTQNNRRLKGGAANSRAPNIFGHVLELRPPKVAQALDHSANIYVWDEFLRGGNPEDMTHDAYYQSAVSNQGWLTNPDNMAFDHMGRIWICTDGQQKTINKTEGLYVAQSEGMAKGGTALFFTAPVGAEVTGPAFTPDSTTLFLSVQHPGEQSSFSNPSTRWPDFEEGMPPRPSIIAITHEKGKVIGS